MSGRIHHVIASLVVDGLRHVAPEIPFDVEVLREIAEADEREGVDLVGYRRLLQVAHAHDGGLALLSAGQLARERSHPLLFVLLNSDSPESVIDKQVRLAAFIHSRHHLVLEHIGAREMTLVHVSSEDTPPEPAEHLAACGQYLVVFEEIGCRELCCRFPDSAQPQRWVYEAGRFRAPAPGGGYQRWHLRWASFEPTRKPMPGLDELLLADQRELRESVGPAAEVERVVRRDLARTWKLAEVAASLEMSPRSLQRTLAGVGERYSDLIDRIRNDEAARLLRETSLSVTEIGYVCGFADAAHFSRSFKRRFEQPPSVYRQQQPGLDSLEFSR
ncbi:helix-turn-helix transcriptional regulator [Enhygromyxa salina]|uniref:Urease operon transcriptional activator n=1 Tax=Enhygromyxa salina TaxID=215803 RepID=A0A2S9YW86_9BACT|nr:helix-turn-helix transcriptional regulator [Enhygromyxa salina]PRQ09344.1 Urease operon transcriptional activator [Enhygromyxa salina]